MFGANNMSSIEYDKEFKPWHNSLTENNVKWDFKHEMRKYCRADVELLGKSVLKFRQMFKEKLDIDPWRYTTLASLCMSIYRGCFLPEKSIVANEQNKNISRVSREWLIYLNNPKIKAEQPVFIEKDKIDYDENKIHDGKIGEDKTVYFKSKSAMLTVDGLDKK